MTEYPTGVLQNFSTPNLPPDLKPVSEDRWKTFVPAADANQAFSAVQKLSSDAKMGVATTGQSSQYVYFDLAAGTITSASKIDPKKPPDVCVRLVAGQAPADDGSGTLIFIEYVGWLFDGSQTPRSFIDTYPTGTKPTQLKCRRITAQGGELYWAA